MNRNIRFLLPANQMPDKPGDSDLLPTLLHSSPQLFSFMIICKHEITFIYLCVNMKNNSDQ